MRKEGLFRKTAKRHLDEAIHAARSLAAAYDGVRPAYDRLLSIVRSRTALLRPSSRPRDYRTPLNVGLLALARHHADWLRPIEAWHPLPLPALPVFTALAHHLFARYPVPAFMTSVWFDIPPWEALPQHAWYKHLGLGHSMRTAGLPLRFTRAMAHRFVQAPHHYSAFGALRWAQVQGLGSSEKLARAIATTQLGKALKNEEFWESVLRFFIKYPSLDLAQVGPIVDFLQYQKFESREGISTEGVFGVQPPPRPDYSMKGRTLASVLRQMEEWHRQLGLEMQHACLTWKKSPLQGFRLVEGSEALGNMHLWTITELLSSAELVLEGKAMCHCVASYVEQCVRRRTSIWSLQIEHQRGRQRRLTIEVDLQSRTICQARGKCNRWPQVAEQEILQRWAAQEGLKMACAFTG